MLSSSPVLNPFASAARTATATSAASELVGATMLTVTVTITAKSGTTPTLDVTVEGSPDGTNGWHTIATVAQFSDATGTKTASLGPAALPRYIRTVATIGGGTPSITFSVGIDVSGSDGQTGNGDYFVTQAAFNAQGASGRELASAVSTTNQTGISTVTDLTGLTITFTVGARPVVVEAYLPYLFSATLASKPTVTITDENNVIKRSATLDLALNSGEPAYVRERISVAGTYTRKVRLLRTSGSGTLNNNVSGDTTYVSSIRATEG